MTDVCLDNDNNVYYLDLTADIQPLTGGGYVVYAHDIAATIDAAGTIYSQKALQPNQIQAIVPVTTDELIAAGYGPTNP